MRHREEFRSKLERDYLLYNTLEEQFPMMDNQILSIVVNTAFGEAEELVKDLGIKKEDLYFTKSTDIAKIREKKLVNQSDSQWGFFMSSLFTPIDMTDYDGAPINEYDPNPDILVDSNKI